MLSYEPDCHGTQMFRNNQKKYTHHHQESFVDEFDKDIPGPGAYESIRLDRIENPEWVIGTEQ